MAWMGFINSVYSLRANNMRVTREVESGESSRDDETVPATVRETGKDVQPTDRRVRVFHTDENLPVTRRG
jgi:hypothetical protein